MPLTVEISSDERLPPEFDWAAVAATSYWPDDHQAVEDYLTIVRLSYVARKTPPDQVKVLLLAASEATPFSVVNDRLIPGP